MNIPVWSHFLHLLINTHNVKQNSHLHNILTFTMIFNVTSMKNILSPFSQGSWKNIVEPFPTLDLLPFLGLSNHWQLSTITLRWRYFRSFSQDEFRRQQINALDPNNCKLWSLVLTILCFMFFFVVFAKGPTRCLV